jgi:hypothetical protein
MITHGLPGWDVLFVDWLIARRRRGGPPPAAAVEGESLADFERQRAAMEAALEGARPSRTPSADEPFDEIDLGGGD